MEKSQYQDSTGILVFYCAKTQFSFFSSLFRTIDETSHPRHLYFLQAEICLLFYCRIWIRLVISAGGFALRTSVDASNIKQGV